MAKKPTVTTLQSGFNSTEVLNSNFEKLRDAFDNTLSLDGSTPNAMEADLDLNGNNLIGAVGLLVNGTDYLAEVEAAKAAALVAQAAAETAETNAETAETNAETAETAAASSASAASTSATNAATSATAASLSETAAASSEANTSASETAAGLSETAAATSETAAALSEANASASATAAATSATNASTSETNAAASATEAATSEANAATSATNASTSETNAATSATAALASQTAAATSESNASTSAANAATSETNASTSASTASTKATEAATSATNASTSETNAATSATSAATSATSAQASKDAALAALDSFDDRYLGQKATDPTLDNDGDALVTGALYFNTADDVMKVYEGSVWVAAYASLSGALLSANSLSDVLNAAAARTNLGLGTAATTASTDYATAAQGSLADSALQSGDNISALTNDAGYTTNVGDITNVSAGTGLSGGGASGTVTISHADTSSQGSVNNSGATVIQDVTLDTYGHVTGLASKTLTAADVGAITGNQTITLSGDVSGSGTTSIVVTVADDSHNHVISNVDGLQTALDAKLASSSYTASDVLTKVKTVDGSGSGLDADLLDGQHGSYYYSPSNPPAASAPSSAQVGSATAGLSVGAVGTYAYLYYYPRTTTSPGTTRAGSDLRYANGYAAHTGYTGGGTPSGTWRCMGYIFDQAGGTGTDTTTVWLRIS
ncbi:putative phage tail fiber protein [Celeribacter phage P12053L]|uniref:Putative phage tail fiber protein n=1 Tax=Celeribacter phage P12053L TaxID=1197951 RepID=I6S6K3_9CAUD|nr:tail fiber protein [Celeribacter phage P12053L]AFM54660.1 putative phage tail fiber protein [Celeribacter phage P12053L]